MFKWSDVYTDNFWSGECVISNNFINIVIEIFAEPEFVTDLVGLRSAIDKNKESQDLEVMKNMEVAQKRYEHLV